uniref:uncharacterized protein LOC100181624 isoform X2 n=1 Tax=Ciona intestinalis TaxID=7719 RepID=UPI000EF4696E|nr:uncharacterized protein LOC100181624 isoform X2 [Ciona intestinalis]|eukprot:XP_026694167.1 uncharacterized protein LOC100181624 isoform X2 [Ciona intestinalis]
MFKNYTSRKEQQISYIKHRICSKNHQSSTGHKVNMNKPALLFLLVVGLLILTDTAAVGRLGRSRRRRWYWNQMPASAEDTNARDIYSYYEVMQDGHHPYYEVMQRLNEAEQ